MTNNSLIKYLANETDTLEFGTQLARACSDTAVIFLYGNLGAGKTTLVRGFLRGLGYEEKVKSPTYTLVEMYQLKKNLVYHFDFYRVHDVQELEFIGIQDYFVPHAICLIEWPENGTGLLPPADLSCYIETQDLGREIKIVAHTALGMDILKRQQQ